MRVMFMGTPDFAVTSLQALLGAGFDICAVVTKTDKPKGRGMKMTVSPVKELALAHNLDVLQPETLKGEGFLPELIKYKPDIIVVVAYGKLLPKYILDFPKYGCINLHGSLLPKYRGAAPIQWSIINGDIETGVTTMYMNEGMDTGDMIYKEKTPIYPNDNAQTLFERLASIGAELLVKTIRDIESGTAPREAQNSSEATYAPMITKEICKIDFAIPSVQIVNLIRGLSPSPCAYFQIGEAIIKVISASLGGDTKERAGTVVCADTKNGLEIACLDGKLIKIEEIIPQGSKKMTSGQYVNGHKIEIGTLIN